MGIVSFIAYASIFLIFSYIGYGIVCILIDCACNPSTLRFTTIKEDGSKNVEIFDLEQSSNEELAELTVKLKKLRKKSKPLFSL